jgi:hypothetical protein|tara:strand:+ start:672 stop:953 length:282 start_codon:yes stop_codon:yes gene_type:complete
VAIVKTIVPDKIEVLELGPVQVRTATIIEEDGVELTRSFHRHVVVPSDKSSGSWEDTDISGEDQRVQDICNAAWTPEVKAAYQAQQDANNLEP